MYEPALSELGDEAVRADRDLGALIISEMIQRLAVADLVVADVTLPNANVYYEVGVRHAAQQRGCVLVAADWSRPMFDLAQMRQARFELPDGAIPAADAPETVETLVTALKPLIEGTSPVFDAITGYPDNVDQSLLSAFRSAVDELSCFDADVRAICYQPFSERPAAARALVARYGDQPAVRDAVALQLLRVCVIPHRMPMTGHSSSPTSTGCQRISRATLLSWNIAHSRWRTWATWPPGPALSTN